MTYQSLISDYSRRQKYKFSELRFQKRALEEVDNAQERLRELTERERVDSLITRLGNGLYAQKNKTLH